MTYENPGQAALDYFPCRYGNSKLLFRGPRRRLQGDYIAFLGGTETYGKFIETPFPMLLEHETGMKSVNLGCVNAGVDAYLSDKSLMDICTGARVTVVQVMGAQNMSNRFYAVHPRRNDRFLRASNLLQTIFGEVDFTEFNFTRHMLKSLADTAPAKFPMVEQELKDAWVARMKTMLEQIDGKVVLLWMADHAPCEQGATNLDQHDPMFVDRAMLDAVADHVSATVEIVAGACEQAEGLQEMVFGPMEEPAAEEMLGPVIHRRAATALAAEVKKLL